MDWKVKLEGDDGTLGQIQQAYKTPAAKVSRDGVDWFLESDEFMAFTDPTEVRQKAGEILTGILAAGGEAGKNAKLALGPVIRMHYDGSKSVFRAEA